MAGLAAAGIALAVSTSCTPSSPDPTATPLPTSVPFTELYDFMQSEKNSNPTRVEYFVDVARPSVIEGQITNIKDSKLQFHVHKRTLRRDEYVECAFRQKGSVIRLNVGQLVKIYGELDTVDAAVKLKNCRIVP